MAQCDRYITMILEACDRVSATPMIGQSCDDVYAGMRKLPVGRHIIYYYARGKGLEVAGILHDRMTPSHHIGHA